MFCTNCGAQLSEGTKFCTSCGAPVAGAGPALEPEAQPSADVAPDSAPMPDPVSIPEPVSDPAEAFQTASEPMSEPVSETELMAIPEPISSGFDSEPEPVAATEPMTIPEPVSGHDSEPTPESASAPMPEPSYDSAAGSQPAAETVPDFQPPSAPDFSSQTATSSPKKNTKLPIIIAAAVAVVALVVGGFFLLGKGGSSKLAEEVTPQIEELLEEEYGDSFEGFASNDYVEEAKYHVKDVEVSDIEEENGRVTATAEATIQNRFFVSEATFTVSAHIDSDNEISSVRFELEDQTTTPRCGVTRDDDNGGAALDSELSSDKKSCSVETTGCWVTGGTKVAKKYIFTGKKWELDSSNTTGEQNQWDVAGTYYSGDDYIEITNWDNSRHAATVKFYMECSLNLDNGSEDCSVTATLDSVQIMDAGDDYYWFRFEDYGAKTSTGRPAFVHVDVYFNPTEEGELALFADANAVNENVSNEDGYAAAKTAMEVEVSEESAYYGVYTDLSDFEKSEDAFPYNYMYYYR